MNSEEDKADGTVSNAVEAFLYKSAVDVEVKKKAEKLNNIDSSLLSTVKFKKEKVTVKDMIWKCQYIAINPLQIWDKQTQRTIYRPRNIYEEFVIDYEDEECDPENPPRDITLFLLGCCVWDVCLTQIFQSDKNPEATKLAKLLEVDKTEKNAKAICKFFKETHARALTRPTTRTTSSSDTVDFIYDSKVGLRAKLLVLTTTQLRELDAASRAQLFWQYVRSTSMKPAHEATYNFATSKDTDEYKVVLSSEGVS